MLYLIKHNYSIVIIPIPLVCLGNLVSSNDANQFDTFANLRLGCLHESDVVFFLPHFVFVWVKSNLKSDLKYHQNSKNFTIWRTKLLEFCNLYLF